MIHVNTETGETGTCKAQQGKCPYGGITGLDNHYETKKSARAAAEKIMDEKFSTISSISSKDKPLQTRKNAKNFQERTQKVSHLREKIQAQVSADEEFLRITKNDKSAATYKERKKASQRLKEFAVHNPSEWRTGQKHANKLTQRNVRPEYIESIDKKHITSKSAGSKFTDSKIKKAEDVLALALAQRGSLKGDDRNKLIEAGASPEAFLPVESGVRYLQVKTNGTEALKDTATMKDSDVLTIVAKGRNDGKPSSLSFSTEVKEQPTTDYATVIIGPDMDENKKPIPNTEVLWTMHPGTPTRGIRSETIRENGLDDGDKITVGELRKRFGKDIKVNTKLIS